jgi:AMMECR1 domain-containing protein
MFSPSFLSSFSFAGTHEPQSLRHLESHTIKAATSDDRFPFFDAGTGGANLPNLRITVSIIHSLEVRRRVQASCSFFLGGER